MSANLEKIVKVDVSLATPVSNNVNFDNILIIGHAPQTPVGSVPAVGVYSSLNEVTELGYVTTGSNADPVGVAARVAYSQNPRPKEIYIATVVSGDSGAVATTLDNAVGMLGWYCICPVGLTNSEVAEIVAWTETQNKICGYVEMNPASPVVEAGLYLRSFAVFPKETDTQADADVPMENKYGAAVAMAVKALGCPAGGETWALQQLAVISPASLSTTFIASLKDANVSYVLGVASKVVTTGGKTNAGEWIDVIRFRDWLRNDMQTRVVNLLATNHKIPYTDNGIALVENQMLASLIEGQVRGGITPTEYDADGNAIHGFTTSVPLASELTGIQKSSRVLENCRFSARLAGAIHVVEITGGLTLENL